MSGSSPLAEVVTRSTGTLAEGFVAASKSELSLTRSTSAFDLGPKFEPPNCSHYRARASFGFDRLDRCRSSQMADHEIAISSKILPISSEPMIVPSRSIKLPLA